MSDDNISPLGWLHLSWPREYWHRLSVEEQEALRDEFARIRGETETDGAAVFGPYQPVGFGPWARFVYFEFPSVDALFHLEERLQAIDYMKYVDFENRLGRVYYSPDRRGDQPYCVAAVATHDDAWYSLDRDERRRIEAEDIVPSLGPIFEAGGSFVALNTCDITRGPEQFFLWEAPSLTVVSDARRHWDTFWRHHRGAWMIIGRKVDR